ncbi:MAG TPA: O-antigen ligase family protein [Thermoanaerobaculia bacterium]|nr:O-antigen ligase family protein [Thermoanaerobaculia bacterium]
MTWLGQRLSLPEETPTSVVLAIAFYLAHLLCSGWVASSECFVAFAMMAFLYALYRKQIRLSFHILYFPLLIYGIASTASALAAPRAIHAFGENALWLKMALFPMALILFRNVPRSRDLALQALLIFGVFSASFGLFQYFVLARRDLEHRITGPTAHVMTLSGLLLAVALVFLVLWIHDLRNLWLLGGTLVVTFTLLLTFTRSAWIGWVVGAGILLVSKRPRMLIFAVPAVVFFVTFMPLPLFGRLVSSFDARQSSNLDRIRMVQAGVEIIKDYPLLGVGPANVKEVYPLYRKHDAPRFRIPHLHNNVVQLWAERGVLALAAYLLFLALFLRECARAWNGPAGRFAEIGVTVLFGLAAAGMFEFNFGDTEVFWVLLDISALVVAYTEQTRPSNERPLSAVPVNGP